MINYLRDCQKSTPIGMLPEILNHNNLAVIDEFAWIFDSSLNRLTKSVYTPTGSVKSHFGEFTNLSCEYITIKNVDSLTPSLQKAVDKIIATDVSKHNILEGRYLDDPDLESIFGEKYAHNTKAIIHGISGNEPITLNDYMESEFSKKLNILNPIKNIVIDNDNNIYAIGYRVEQTSTYEQFVIGDSSQTGVGNYSVIEGTANTTNANYSHVEGANNVIDTLGEYSHVEGINNYVNGMASHAEGMDVSISSNYSHAEGKEIIIIGDYSHAEGFKTYAVGKASHAEGNLTLAQGNYSHTEGAANHTHGDYSHAEGYTTHAIGRSSHTEGESTMAVGIGSHASGNFTLANANYAHVEGYQTYAIGKASHVEGSGEYDQYSNSIEATSIYEFKIDDWYLELNPTDNTANLCIRSKDLQVNGQDVSITWSKECVDILNIKYEDNRNIGVPVKEYIGLVDHKGNLYHKFILTWYNIEKDILDGIKSFEIYGAKYGSMIDYAHTEGYNCLVANTTDDPSTGIAGHAEGWHTEVRGIGAHSEGKETLALGKASHAEGKETLALGEASHAEGYASRAIGQYSHTSGKATHANGENSFAAGLGSIATYKNSMAIGKYSKTDNTNKALFAVGNGTSEADTKNIFFIDDSGNGHFTGEVSFKNYLVKDKDKLWNISSIDALLLYIKSLEERLAFLESTSTESVIDISNALDEVMYRNTSHN